MWKVVDGHYHVAGVGRLTFHVARGPGIGGIPDVPVMRKWQRQVEAMVRIKGWPRSGGPQIKTDGQR